MWKGGQKYRVTLPLNMTIYSKHGICIHILSFTFCVLSFIEEVWEAGRETWSQEIATACKCGNAEALILLGTKTREPLTELVQPLVLPVSAMQCSIANTGRVLLHCTHEYCFTVLMDY